MKKFPNSSRLQSSLEMIKTKIFLLFIVFLFSSLNVFSQNSESISNCNDFVVGSAAAWPYVLVATTIDSGAISHLSQTFTMNVTSLPASGANVRVYKTVANGNDFFGNPVVLANGMNTFTVPAVTFDRAVKFQFSSGDIEFNALSLNGVDSDCITNISSIQTTEHKIILNTFPNPSNGSLFFQSNQPIDEIQIHDISGRVVLEVKPQLNIYHIQTTQLKNQLYFVKCLINQDWITRKIILN